MGDVRVLQQQLGKCGRTGRCRRLAWLEGKVRASSVQDEAGDVGREP